MAHANGRGKKKAKVKGVKENSSPQIRSMLPALHFDLQYCKPTSIKP
ncbi:CD9 antigen, b [Corchorus capsularis]|uniref:CD9 antigen, b n=1 Tax=Corchorus capsularis TaxID=210143 RepID=A0A1R3H2C7_COCAP|nr:CD9 antigen, b [Corchorus capsularis]